jgi:hypothetical protein
MTLLRRLVLLPFLTSVAASVYACGDDGGASTAPPTVTGGSAGASQAGAAGAASQAGNGGAGANTQGGAGGTASAGTGGTTAGAGGTAGTGGSAGTGGTGGSAGSAGTGNGCQIDSDCVKGTAPTTKPPGCAEAYCTDAGVCGYRAVDQDQDGSRTNKCVVVSDEPIEVVLGKDCDDSVASINPGAWDGPEGDGHTDACGDGVDQNCSGADGDDVLSNGGSCACSPGDVSNCSETAAGVPIVFPGGAPAPGSVCSLGSKTCQKDAVAGGKWGPCVNARGPSPEVCNGADDDCDGKTDEEDAADQTDWFYDGDGDGQAATVPGSKPPVPFAAVKACISTPPSQYPVECTDAYCGSIPKDQCCPKDAWRSNLPKIDCDDRSASALVGGIEVCGNAIDENCDGKLDETGAVGEKDWFYDGDGDGYGDKTKAPVRACAAPCDEATEPGCLAKWKTNIPGGDCNDANPGISPGASENCSTPTVDENCNGNLLDQCSCGLGSPALDCGVPGDCAYQQGGSTCVNGAYTACPQPIAKVEYCPDLDADGYCSNGIKDCKLYCPSGDAAQAPPAKYKPRSACANPGGASDCSDADPKIFPGAAELCGDGKDSNCASNGNDSDSDGYNVGSSCSVVAPAGTAGACSGAGSLACTSAGATTTKCVSPDARIGQSTGQTSQAPNGSWDWNCDGKVTITRTQSFGTSTICGSPTIYTLDSSAVVKAANQWTSQNVLVTTPGGAPTCSSFGSESTCSKHSTPSFYAEVCTSSTSCAPIDCNTTFKSLACTWTSSGACATSKAGFTCGPKPTTTCF